MGAWRSCEDGPSPGPNLSFPRGAWFPLHVPSSGSNDRAGQSVMKSVAGLPLFFAILAGCAEARELGRIEQSAAGKPYDYVVHVPITYSIGLHQQVREDLYRIR